MSLLRPYQLSALNDLHQRAALDFRDAELAIFSQIQKDLRPATSTAAHSYAGKGSGTTRCEAVAARWRAGGSFVYRSDGLFWIAEEGET